MIFQSMPVVVVSVYTRERQCLLLDCLMTLTTQMYGQS